MAPLHVNTIIIILRMCHFSGLMAEVSKLEVSKLGLSRQFMALLYNKAPLTAYQNNSVFLIAT